MPFRSHGFPHLYSNVVTIGNRWPQEPLPVFWPGAFRPPRGPEATTEEQPGPSADPLVSRLIAFCSLQRNPALSQGERLGSLCTPRIWGGARSQ